MHDSLGMKVSSAKHSHFMISNFMSRNYIQERPTQIYANCVLYTVGGMQTNPVSPQKLKGKEYSSDVYYSPTINKLIYKLRANTYDFWLSGQNGKYNSNILIPSLGPFSLKNDALPLNSLFWSPPTAVHLFDASR